MISFTAHPDSPEAPSRSGSWWVRVMAVDAVKDADTDPQSGNFSVFQALGSQTLF